MSEPNISGGEGVYAGEVKLTLNPPTPDQEGVAYRGHWVRAELDDEGTFSVRIFGEGQYGDRSITDHKDITDPGVKPIETMLKQVLAAYSESIKTQVMGAAYSARQFALNQGESIATKKE